MKRYFYLFPLMAFAFFGCIKPTNNPTPNISGVVYMWIAPAADTKLDGDFPDQNFITSGDNTCARFHIPGNVAWHVSSFIKYKLPILPPGTVIDEAYFEMFHSGTNEDGTSDAVNFFVSTINAVWRADSVTWNKSPDGGVATNGINPIICKLHSMDWSGTTDISNIVKPWFADTSNTTGFGLRVTTTNPVTFFKSFYSNNSFIGAGNKDGRTDSTVGKAPRLLVKIELPSGYSTKDIRWHSLPVDFDIKLSTYFATHGIVYMAKYATGSDWPSDWVVKKGM